MSFAVVAVAGGAGLGALAGSIKSGSAANMYGRGESQKAYDAYKNLVGAGPGQQDVTNSVNANRDYSTVLGNLANTGLYNSSEGNRLAEMQFAPQRQALAQSLQDQMATANRAASAAGRSSNDPILRARLGAEAMRQTATLNSAQYSASMDLGRQSTVDMLGMRGQQVGVLQGMADQAFGNQSNLFNMGSQLQQMDNNAASYESSRGGGLKGAITGGISGAAAGMQMATGFSGMSNATKMTNAMTTDPQSMALNNFKMGPNMSMEQMMGAGSRGVASLPSFSQPQGPLPFNPQYFNPINFQGGQTMFGPTSLPQRMGMNQGYGFSGK